MPAHSSSFSFYLRDHVGSAQIFNIYPRKGAIMPGSDADIIVLNPKATTEIRAKSHHSKLDTNVYEGWAMKVTCNLSSSLCEFWFS